MAIGWLNWGRGSTPDSYGSSRKKWGLTIKGLNGASDNGDHPRAS